LPQASFLSCFAKPPDSKHRPKPFLCPSANPRRNIPLVLSLTNSDRPCLTSCAKNCFSSCPASIKCLSPNSNTHVAGGPMSSFSRREFLKTGARGIAATTVFVPASGLLNARVLGLPAGIQLYTVKNELAKDFDGTLKKVAAIGYREVEAAGFYRKSAASFRKSIEDGGLALPAAHYSLQELLEGLDA